MKNPWEHRRHDECMSILLLILNIDRNSIHPSNRNNKAGECLNFSKHLVEAMLVYLLSTGNLKLGSCQPTRSIASLPKAILDETTDNLSLCRP
jgi:hypothetical protein